MRRRITALIAFALVPLMITPIAGAKNGPKPAYFVDEAKLECPEAKLISGELEGCEPFDAIPGLTGDRFWGIHNGAGYRVETPAGEWNGTLVMWAHGFRGTGLELTVDNHPLRTWLLANGFAWAASSYSKNDYNVAQGVKDTHALAKFFNGLVSKPDRTYITGASMGGHITAVSIEQYPKAYDGAMPICGVLGDFELFDYFLDFNAAAQQLGLGTSTFPVDPAQYLFVDVPTIKASLEAVPGGWPILLNPDGANLKNLTELRSGGERPNFDEAWFFWNTFPNFASGPGNFLFDLGVGDGSLVGSPGNALDNTDVVYQFDSNPALTPGEADFNANVVRVAQDPQGRSPNGLAQVPPISGDIPVPVVSLHNLGDLFVPFHNEVVYAQEVAAHGKSDLLVQRAIRGVGHCDFTGVELVTAFAELDAWVKFGVKPAGDDVLDPAAVAAPDYGCSFTDFSGLAGNHILATPCP